MLVLVCAVAVPSVWAWMEHRWRDEADKAHTKVVFGLNEQIRDLQHDKQLLATKLAPFEAAAAMLYPGREGALEELTVEIKTLIDQNKRSSTEALIAGLEGCYVEVLRNQWAFDALQRAEENRMRLRQPNSTACVELARHSKIPTGTRNLLSLYIATMNEANTTVTAKFSACQSRGFRLEEIDAMHALGESGMNDTMRVKEKLELHFAQLGRPLPASEATTPSGDRAICSSVN